MAQRSIPLQETQVLDYDKGWGTAGGLLLFVLFVGTVSGAIVGFLFAGHVVLSLGICGGTGAGLVLGWMVRGIRE